MRVTQWSQETLVTKSGYSWGEKKKNHPFWRRCQCRFPRRTNKYANEKPIFTCQRHRGSQQTGGVSRETIMPKGRGDHNCHHQSWSFIKADINKHTHLQLWQLCEHSDLGRENGPSSDTSILLVNGTLQLCGSPAQILAKSVFEMDTHSILSLLKWNFCKPEMSDKGRRGLR